MFYFQTVSGSTQLSIAGWQQESGNGSEIMKEVLDGSVFAPMCSILLRAETLRARGGCPVDWGPCTLDQAAWFPLQDGDLGEFDQLYHKNVRAPFALTQALLP